MVVSAAPGTRRRTPRLASPSSRAGSVLILVTFLAVAPAPMVGQEASRPPASQHGTVSQTINNTVVSLGYDRPSQRGRTIFGDILDYDVVWTPGANRATWIEFSTEVTVEGVAVPAGRYGVWTLPHEDGPWEIVLVSDWDTHHSFYPFETEVARLHARSEAGPPMEALAFYFPTVGPYDATLRFHWGEIVVPLRIEVPRTPYAG